MCPAEDVPGFFFTCETGRRSTRGAEAFLPRRTSAFLAKDAVTSTACGNRAEVEKSLVQNQ